MIPHEGFSIKLEFANPPVMPEGKSPAAATHPGMLPLLKRMAAIIRTRFTPDFYKKIAEEALDLMAADVSIDAEAFTKALNSARAAKGLPLLISAEGDVEEAVAEAVRITREQLAEGEEQRFAERLRITREAEAAEAAHEAGDPPPPRGARRGRG